MKFSTLSLIINCITSLQFGLLVTKPILNKPVFCIKYPLHYGIIVDHNVIYEFNRNNISRNTNFKEFGSFTILNIPPTKGWKQRYREIYNNPPKYNVLRCNCEHVARYIHSNISHSTQLPSYKLRKLMYKKKKDLT